MNPEDPMRMLEAHYGRLRSLPVPPIKQRRPIKWWEAAGGLAAGAAMVVVAVAICLQDAGPAKVPVGSIMRYQMRSAGMLSNPAEPRKRAQREGSWHI